MTDPLPLPAKARSRRRSQQVIRRARPLMGTLVGVTLRGPDAVDLEGLARDVFAEMHRLESLLSEWSPTSALALVNDSAGTVPVPVPPELFDVLATARGVARATGGAFDPTWAALAPCWPFHQPCFKLPEPAEIDRARALVDHRDIIIDPDQHTVLLRRPGMSLGLGGAAKAFIAERAADFAVKHGAPDVLIDAGGDVVARGCNGTRSWQVGILDPRSPGALIATLALRDEAVATSGDYRRCIEIAGRRYHHLLDPRTGWPANRSCSATVVAPGGALADALATALFVMGPRGLGIAIASGATAAMVVGHDGDVRLASGNPSRKSRHHLGRAHVTTSSAPPPGTTAPAARHAPGAARRRHASGQPIRSPGLNRAS